ncbi:MAG TPA: apolipoprotein N-acyltransferase [Prolixibacteraceae bacterium]|nr:apolipoprotein N-acyltransferase [Prolixibacteraceae bacterium]
MVIPVVASGVLLALAWLGVSGFILLVALVPLLFVEDFFRESKFRYNSFVFWLFSLITFLVWNTLAVWWIWYATPIGAMFAILMNSFLMALVWWVAHIAGRMKGKTFGRMVLVVAWVSFEYLHYHWDVSWPWLTLGNGLANDVKFIQWYEYTGVFGGSLWILIMNVLFAELIRMTGTSLRRKDVGILLVGLFLLFFPVISSLAIYYSYHEKSDPVRVVIAQPNIDPYNDKFSGMSVADQLHRLLQVSDSLGDSSVDFFVGPETALHEIWENNADDDTQIVAIKQFLKDRYPEAAFVVGASTFYRYFPGDSIPLSARSENGGQLIYDAFNSACFIEKDSSILFYHKTKLVSGVEKMPFKRQLRFLEKWIIHLGGISGTLGTPTDTVIFEKGVTRVAVPICYESGYGEYLSGFIQKGANVFFIITNDGWWRNSPGYRQHLSYSRLRAIEFRRDIARAGNTGISCFIDQRGDLLQKSKWWVKTSLSGAMNRNNRITFYARHGDYLARFSLLLFVLMLLILPGKKMFFR